MAFLGARPVNKHQRGTFADRKPVVAKLHESYEAWIEIKAHFGEPILFARPDTECNPPENLEPRQLSQSIGQSGAWNVER